MDTICFNRACTFPVTRKITCEFCRTPRYCSKDCKINHINEEHQYVCPANSNSLTLEDFEDIGIEIGKGSYGRVRLIRHKLSKCFYALKRISKLALSKKNLIEKARNEVIVQKTLNHPNIIGLIAHIEDPFRIYLILEYAENGDLSQHREKSEDSIWRYFIQTCRAVKYLHNRNIIHRDIKPSNLLRGKCIKLCDFGWSVSTEKPRKTICGTLDYMAPELISGVNYNHKVDIWALGVLLYELFHGYSPFYGDNESEKCSNILRAKYSMSPEVPSQVKDLIGLMLSKSHFNRIGIDEVLLHPWVLQREFIPPLSPGESVYHDIFGNGQINRFSGCLCYINFQNTQISLFTNDIIWETTLEHEQNNANQAKTNTKHSRSRTESVEEYIDLSPDVLNKRKEELEAICNNIEGNPRKNMTRKRQSWYQNLFWWL